MSWVKWTDGQPSKHGEYLVMGLNTVGSSVEIRTRKYSQNGWEIINGFQMTDWWDERRTKEIVLNEIIVYQLNTTINEIETTVRGYYKDKNIALIDGKKAGWVGDDGKVKEVTAYQDEDQNLYLLESVGKFKDDNRDYRKEAIARIKSKLSPEECELLGI